MLDYGFSNFSYEQFAKKGDVLKQINVNKGIDSTLNIIYGETAGALVKKDENTNIEEIVNINSNISAPISEGQKLGEINYMLNGGNVGKVDLVAQKSIKKISVGTMTSKVVHNWFTVLR